MSKREFTVDLIVRSVWSGTVQASSEKEARAIAKRMWCETDPHPFDCCDEDLLHINVEDSVQSTPTHKETP